MFKFYFSVERVARTCTPLLIGFKTVKDTSNTTVGGAMQFHFYEEMNDRMKAPYSFLSVTATAEGVTIHKPDAIMINNASPVQRLCQENVNDLERRNQYYNN